MISLRYHVVSLAACLLALAVGIVLGATAGSGQPLPGFSSAHPEAERQAGDVQHDGDGSPGALAETQAFALAVGPRVVRDTLRNRSVVIVSTADADPADRDALVVLLGKAGATVTGELQLTDAFSDPRQADQLSELTARLLPAGAQLPTSADAGTLAGGLVGALLLVDQRSGEPPIHPVESAAAFAGLQEGGFIRFAPQIQPAQLAVVLTGGTADDDGAGDRAGMVARFALRLDRSGAGAVLAGRLGSAAATGPVGVVRADAAATAALSTVDDVSTPAGRVATVLALAEQAQGGSGQYGTASNAHAAVPAIEG